MPASPLFRFPAAVARDSAVEQWLATRPGELGDIARTWFAQLRQSGPDIRELMHDGCPVACIGDVAFAYVNAFKAHVNLGFYQGAGLDDPAGLLEGSGKHMRHVKLRPGHEPDAAVLLRLIEDARSDMMRRMEAEHE